MQIIVQPNYIWLQNSPTTNGRPIALNKIGYIYWVVQFPNESWRHWTSWEWDRCLSSVSHHWHSLPISFHLYQSNLEDKWLIIMIHFENSHKLWINLFNYSNQYRYGTSDYSPMLNDKISDVNITSSLNQPPSFDYSSQRMWNISVPEFLLSKQHKYIVHYNQLYRVFQYNILP